ncbi:MAG: hypothetical protein AAFV80_11655 [Bacteroidota bacterium]
MKKENHKDQWAEDIFQSMKGHQKAQPRNDLFQAIEDKVYGQSTKVLPIFQITSMAVAVILLLVINTLALHQMNQNTVVETALTQPQLEPVEGFQLISNYKIYE